MPSPAELVAALSRAYALTDVFPAGDPVSLDALGHLKALLREGALVVVSPAGLRVDGIDVPDFHGGSGRFARDLRMLGVEELHFSGDVHVEALEMFVRVLREEATEGGSGRLRPVTHGSGIDLVFQGEVANPGEGTEIIPFPGVTGEEWAPPGDDPAEGGEGLEEEGPPREGSAGTSRPGRALVESIARLFDGPPASPASSLAPLPPEERDPRLVEDIQALLGREFSQEAPVDRMHPDGTPEIAARASPLESDPHFGWAPDPDAGHAGTAEPLFSLDPTSLDAPAGPPGTAEPPAGTFSFPRAGGGRRGGPGADPDWDPFDARESMTRARSGEQVDDPPSGSPPGEDVGIDPSVGLPFAAGGVVGGASFGRRMDPGGNELDSPSSVRDASFADPETLGEAHFGRSAPQSGPRESKPFLEWPGAREESAPGGAGLAATPPPAPGTSPAQGEPFQDLLGFTSQGESSHALFFFDEEVPKAPGAQILGDDVLASASPPEPEEPVEVETEVGPPVGEWDRVMDDPPGTPREHPQGVEEDAPAGAREAPSPSGDEEVPLWHLEPEVPIWDRQEEGAVDQERSEEGESLDTLVHRVLIGFGDQKRKAMGELRARAAPTLNPLILDEFVNAVLDLLRAGEAGTGLQDLARDLTTHGVASRLVARLGQERDPETRRELAGMFGRIGEPLSRALVDALVDEPDRGTRRIYLEALGTMGPEGVGAVHRMLNDARWFVVRNGLALLGDMGDPASVHRILPVLAHPDSRVRREAVAALTRLGGDDLPRILEQRLGDPSGDVRAAAAGGLGARKVEGAAPALRAMLDSEKDPAALEAVIGALGELGETGAVALLEKRAVGSLLTRPPTQIRVAAYRALHAIGTPQARSIVQAAANDRDPEVRAAVAALQGDRRD